MLPSVCCVLVVAAAFIFMISGLLWLMLRCYSFAASKEVRCVQFF